MKKQNINLMIPFLSAYLLISAVLLGSCRWGTFACTALLMIWMELTISIIALTCTTAALFLIARKRQRQAGRRG